MQEVMTLTDANLDAILAGDQPVLLLISNGENLRGDFNATFKKAAAEHNGLIFAHIDPLRNPKATERFDVGSKPALILWHNGEEVTRRVRPWGSDVPLAIEMLKNRMPTPNGNTEKKESAVNNQSNTIVDDKPVVVTDETFQAEVIDYDKPVLVDFWAPWCGPCRMVAPALEKLAKEFAGQVRIAKVNVDENPGLQNAFRIMSIPNLMAIKNRTIVFNQPGALPEAALRQLITQLIALEVPAPAEAAEEQAD